LIWQNLHHPGVVNLQDMFETPVKVYNTQVVSSLAAMFFVKLLSASHFEKNIACQGFANNQFINKQATFKGKKYNVDWTPRKKDQKTSFNRYPIKIKIKNMYTLIQSMIIPVKTHIPRSI